MLDVVQPGVVYVPYGTARYGIVWCSPCVIWYSPVWYSMVWSGLCAVWYMVCYSVTHPIPLPGRWIQ